MNTATIIFKDGSKCVLENVYAVSTTEETMTIAFKQEGENRYSYPSLSSISVMCIN